MKWARPHLLVLLLVGVAWLTPVHDILRSALSDVRVSWLRRQASGDIVLIAIDSRSIENVGTWPWPRSLHARLIDTLQSSGVLDIAFDVDFSSRSTQAEDDAFLEALRRAGGSVVLPVFMQNVAAPGGKQQVHVNRPISRFIESSWTALVNVKAERDAIVRRYSYGDRLDGSLVPSMAAALAGSAKVRGDSFWIDHSIVPSSIPTVSYIDVLRGVPSVLQSLQGKKVIVGGTALELGDRFTVPHGRIVSGPLLQAIAAESIVLGRDLQRASVIFAFAGIAVLGFCMIVVGRRAGVARRAICLLAAGAATEAAAAFLQAAAPIILDTSLFQVAIASYLLVLALDEIDFRGMLGKIADRRFERIAMSLGDGLVCAGADGIVTVCNPAAAAIFRTAANEMVGRPVANLFADTREGGCAIAKLLQAKPQSHTGTVVEVAGLRKDGKTFPLEVCLSGWEALDGVQYGLILRDISDRAREAEKIRYLAEYDSLTGLANRHLLHQHFNAKLVEAHRDGHKIALLLLDLDSFKEINDTLGHTYGDRVLAAVANRLNGLVVGDALVARLGGDEFAMIVSGNDLENRASQLVDKIVAAFSRSPVFVEERPLWVHGSVGVAFYPDHGVTTDELLSNADLALYRAKASGRGQAVIFEKAFRNVFEERLLLEAELKRAVQSGEFELFFQPQVSLQDATLVGAEALIRWHHPLRGLVSPAEFMPIVNTSSMAGDVASWVLRTACEQGSQWQNAGHDVRIAVNLSPSQLRSGDLSMVVNGLLDQTGFSPSLLELEVTEDIVLADEQQALDNFRQLQKLGVRLAFDDFGTGYAGLSYLKKFPFNVLKIDRSFVAELCTSSDDMAIVAATIGISKQLGLSVIAEGIEDDNTAEALRLLACEEGQGYLYGRPMPAAEFERRFLQLRGRAALPLNPAADAA